ncbi:hypothetical protein D7D52_23140 [Nocardia yunnanensis]|uniref:Uncharacterized protein n=1 Tax=Nocardia yunnanensis TaxID=2382165 RepID=A0A386ZED9_9NOCA|nr:hypothetical protein [Nocardia yunnanensis]AYF76242.1 hypothetical protein D7D52_23140 [Nocardia yunnanensis]
MRDYQVSELSEVTQTPFATSQLAAAPLRTASHSAETPNTLGSRLYGFAGAENSPAAQRPDSPPLAPALGHSSAPAMEPVPMWHRAVPTRLARPPLLWLVGVHGGAGVSSLAASLSWAGDAGQRWPARIGLAGDMDSPLVVLVGRSHLRGVNALHRALLAHQGQATPVGSHVVGVLTVADSARPLPIPVAQRREEMEGLALALGARTWRLGWLEQWRALEPYELAAWEPATEHTPMDDGDPTRTPPQPVRLLAEQILTAARAAGARITERARNGAPSASP